MQHFRRYRCKTDKFISKVADITYTETGSELISLLFGIQKIKLLQPEINKAQRTQQYPYFVYHYVNEDGYICFNFDKSSVKTRKGKSILNHYSSKQVLVAISILHPSACQLCQCLMGLHDHPESCFIDKQGNVKAQPYS